MEIIRFWDKTRYYSSIKIFVNLVIYNFSNIGLRIIPIWGSNVLKWGYILYHWMFVLTPMLPSWWKSIRKTCSVPRCIAAVWNPNARWPNFATQHPRACAYKSRRSCLWSRCVLKRLYPATLRRYDAFIFKCVAGRSAWNRIHIHTFARSKWDLENV